MAALLVLYAGLLLAEAALMVLAWVAFVVTGRRRHPARRVE